MEQTMKTVLVLSDLEGITGVYSLTNQTENAEKYYTEVIAYINKAYHLGYTVYYCDMHGNGEYIREKVSIEAEFVHVIPKQILEEILTKQSFECAVLLGFHAKAGSSGILAHTFIDEIQDLLLENRSVGEIEIITEWLRGFSVPVVFISGDSAALPEVKNINCVYYTSKSNDKPLVLPDKKILSTGLKVLETVLRKNSFPSDNVFYCKTVKVVLRGDYCDIALKNHGYNLCSPSTVQFESVNEFMHLASHFFELVFAIRYKWLLNALKKIIAEKDISKNSCFNSEFKIMAKKTQDITKEDLIWLIKSIERRGDLAL